MPTRQTLLLDACVVINLEATNRFDDIARSAPVQFAVARPASVEVGSLRVDVDGMVHAIPIDLAPRVTARTLIVADLVPEEFPLYVDLVRDLGDGEAASIAVALSRNLRVAIDDKKARRVCVERGLAEPLRTTDILREYCDHEHLAPEHVGDLLKRVRDLASFVPARSDPNRKWWVTSISD